MSVSQIDAPEENPTPHKGRRACPVCERTFKDRHSVSQHCHFAHGQRYAKLMKAKERGE
jgi:hypothetical protein